MRIRHTSICAGLLLLGCVSSGKYDDLKAKYDAAQAKLTEGHARIESLEQATAREQESARQLAAEMAKTRADLAELERQREDRAKLLVDQMKQSEQLRNDLADLVKDRSRLKESTDMLRQALSPAREDRGRAHGAGPAQRRAL